MGTTIFGRSSFQEFIFRKLMGYQEGKFYDDFEEQQNWYFVLGCKF
jgi:hypothetical protein